MKNYYRKNPAKPKTLKNVMSEKFKSRAKDMNMLTQATVKKPKRKKTLVEKVFGGGPKEEYNIKKGRAATSAIKGAKASMKKDFPELTKRVTGMKKGGSTVNKAGNYTKPTMRKALFNRIKAGGKGGRPGQWSARKAQMLAKQYKAKGGGYRG